MKLFLVFVGAVCLASSIHAQSTLATTVAKAIATSNTNLATAIQTVNSTINTADKTIATAWTTYVNSMSTLYNTYLNRFKNYTTMDLSQITSALNNMKNTVAPMPMQDGTITQMFSSLQMNTQQIGESLTAAATNMSSATGAFLATCTTKYASKLAVAPISIDRVRDCLSAEATRFTNIATNVTAQYTNAVTSATNYLSVVSVCDTPTAAVLNNPSTNYGSLSTQCLSNFLQKFSSLPLNTNTFDNMRYTQVNIVYQKVQRCGRLVQLDIQDRILALTNSFATCMKTGS